MGRSQSLPDSYSMMYERAEKLDSCEPSRAGGHGSMPNMHGLEHPRIRQRFIAKVYSIVAIQILATFLICLAIATVPALREFALKYGQTILLVGGFLSMSIMCFLVCCVARQFPLNIILLGIFTFLESITVGCVVILYDVEAIIMAFGTTGAIFLIFSVFAIYTNIDFTKCIWLVIIVSFVLMIYGFVILCFPSKTMILIYSCLGTMAAIFYILVDTQLIIGGRSCEYSEEDYIEAAISLYTDILYLFINLLQLLNNK